MKDNSIIEKIRNGEDSLIEQLYVDNRRWLILFISKHYKGLDIHSAEDIYQEAFIILIEKITKGQLTELSASFRTYLVGIAKNLSVRWLMRKKRFNREVALYRIENFYNSDTILPSEDKLINYLKRIIVRDKIKVLHSGLGLETVKLQVIVSDGAKNDTLFEVIKTFILLQKAHKNKIFFDAVIKGSYIIQIKCPPELISAIIDSFNHLMNDEDKVEVVIKPAESFVVNKEKLQKVKVSICKIIFEDNQFEIKFQPSQFVLYVFFLNHPEGVFLKHLTVDYKDFFFKIFEKLDYEKFGMLKKENEKEKYNILVKFSEQVNSKISKINALLLQSLTMHGFSKGLINEYKITGKRSDKYEVLLAAKQGFVDLGEFDTVNL